ncbi:hypothetical protein RIF29_28940 [Crotalaria pallida]|uniref:Uncharacterized protein n=1 Tax=Crotalaria pallida TaxID=3830 RepID=A0AAN9EDL1_CROPI
MLPVCVAPGINTSFLTNESQMALTLQLFCSLFPLPTPFLLFRLLSILYLSFFFYFSSTTTTFHLSQNTLLSPPPSMSMSPTFPDTSTTTSSPSKSLGIDPMTLPEMRIGGAGGYGACLNYEWSKGMND